MTYATLIQVSRWCTVAALALWVVNAARHLMRPGIDWSGVIDAPMLLVALLAWSNLRHLRSTTAKNPALLQAAVQRLTMSVAIATMLGLAAFAVGIAAAIAMH